MVLAERNTENVRNGRRSRGPSPNGAQSDSSSDEDNGISLMMSVHLRCLTTKIHLLIPHI